jgi:4-amino-4-deoxy-L-arabinose transferase-like glycosyltransferase
MTTQKTASQSAWSLGKGLAGALGLICLAYPLFFYGLGQRDLYSSHEGRAAQDAQSILNEGVWALPHLFDLHPELQKPPLYYWLVAILSRLRGTAVDETAVRLPAALSALGTVLAVYAWCVFRGRARAGLLAALVLATAMHYTWLARVGRIDMPLTLTTTVALLAFHESWSQSGTAGGVWRIVAYLAIATSIMLKGPIGLILALVVLAPMILLYRSRGLSPCSLGLRSGLAIIALAVGPWFAWAMWKSQGALFQTFLIYHNVERALGGGELRAHPFWFYVPRLALDFLPWTPVLLVCMPMAVLWSRPDSDERFSLIWLGSMFLLLSLVRFKRADYLLPAYPGAAILVGCMLDRLCGRIECSRLAWTGVAGTIACIASASWVYYVERVLPKAEPFLEDRRFASEVRKLAPQPALILFFRAENHALAFHLGPPLDTFLEWENLDIWVGRPGPYYIVMPVDCLEESPRHLTAGRLEAVLRNTDVPNAANHERPLVLVRTHPNHEPFAARRDRPRKAQDRFESGKLAGARTDDSDDR